MKPLGPQTHSQADSHISGSQMVEMLAGMNAAADMQVVQRTRRAIMQAAADLREQQRRSRRNTGFVVLAITVLAMIMTPALWSTVDDFLGGEQLFELPGMVMVLVLLLFSTIIAALIISFKSQQIHGRR